MEPIIALILKTAGQVWATFLHNWPYLVVSVLVAVALKLFANPNKVSAFLMKYRRAGVVGATAVAVATPLCSCGTTAIILGMMANLMPWAPIIAFMVSSPLSSPEELVYSAGLFGWPFALVFYAASIILGLTGGMVGEFFERRGWLANQTRFSTASRNSAEKSGRPDAVQPGRAFSLRPDRPALLAGSAAAQAGGSMVLLSSGAAAGPACACGATQSQQPSALCGCETEKPEPDASACACGDQPSDTDRRTVTWRMFLSESLDTGKRLLAMFIGFAFIGYFLNGLIPSAWVAAVFGPGNIYSVPLAATLGLPLYINSEASLPLVRALMDGGMSQGAALAFLITGAGTSIGALAGALTIARWRVIAIVVGTLWVGAIAMGYLYNFLTVSGIF